MASDWPEVAFSDVLVGGTRNGIYKKKEFHGSGIKIVNMGELFANPRLFSVPMKRVELTEKEKAKSCLQRGDLLFARRSLVAEGAGKCSIVMEIDEPTTFESSIIRGRPDPEKVDGLFLYYLFNSPHGMYLLGTIRRQVAVSGITGSDLVQLKIPIPPIDDQRAIAHILGSLDDKIELNRRMNKTLEAMARAIFKSWFIDFDPVIDNALRAGNPIPERFAERVEMRRQMLGQNQPSSPGPFSQGEKGGQYRGKYDFSGLLDTTRELRKNQTTAENLFWGIVRNRRFLGLKFRRQHQVGDYVVDFYCHEHRLVIELDGGIHNKKLKKDAKRDAYMESLGFTVLRFSNSQVFEDIEGILAQIAACITPSPSGRGGGEGSMDEVHRLFPDSFQDSDLGEMPKGWEIKSLDKIADYLNGLACQKYPPEEGKESLPVIKIRELRQGITANTDRATTAIPGNYIVEDGDVLFSWSGSLLIDIWTQGRGVLNQHLFKVTSADYPKWFYYYWTEHHLTEFQRVAAYKATTMGHIKRHHLSDAHVYVPNEKVMQGADEQVNPLFDLRIQNELEIQKLSSLRDTLLPKLISGELRVPDAQKFVESACALHTDRDADL